ncbi:nucleoside-diphosphate sugar epimerase/dehydratase [Paracoccus sp. SCSIO 75233]|uniref:polysaccharide biosynthesis protein n=1 Tax=Paracoccus sp. SCSIO 75233 TaxID=3017782 RepID=UPI0022F1238D|nr:nucleoside-diphosphate sugar epimerase/dehydratase [Paracoccus sp. SCSIO 75233]WBU52630.1 nucleoside-diphosphate sugar epimerase/dehydratase [Paracoccus sp. SCSIO 75233]
MGRTISEFQRVSAEIPGRINYCATELRRNKKLVFADIFSVAIAASLAVFLAAWPHYSFVETEILPKFVLASLFVSMPIMLAAGFYRRHRHFATVPGLWDIVPGTALAVAISALVTKGTGWLPQIPLNTFPIMFMIQLCMITTARLVARQRAVRRHAPRAAKPSDDAIPAVLVGLGATSDLFMRAVHQGLSQYRILGIIDDAMDSTDLLFHSVPILGSVREPDAIIERLMAGKELPRILLLTETVTQFDREGIEALIGWAEAQGIKVRSLPNLTETQAGAPGQATNVVNIDPEDVLTRPQKTVQLRLLRDTYRDQRVLVTGAGGSIGSELVRQIASLKPKELVLIDNCEFNAYQVDRLLARHFPDVPRTLHLCCIRDREHVEKIFDIHRPDMVFNAAALKHVPLVENNPCEGVLTNVIGTRNVCDAARSVSVKAFVQVSTDKAVNTTNIMGATKRVAEFYCQAQDLITRDIGCMTRFFAVRFGNVLGSSGSLIPLFQEQIARGGPLTVTHPDMERYFMTIREAVELTLVAAAQGLKANEDNGRIYVLDMGQPVRIVDLAERMIRMAGKQPGKDIKIDFIGIRPGEKLFEELFDHSEVITPAGFAGVSCAIPNPVPISRLRASLLRLEKSARAGDGEAVRAGLADLVPGFASERGEGDKVESGKVSAPAKPKQKGVVTITKPSGLIHYANLEKSRILA